MAASQLKKKATYLLIFIGLTVLVLSVLSMLESWLQATFLPQFQINFGSGWDLTDESSKVMVNVTVAKALDTAFRILKILLWMSIVIAAVRFVAQLVMQTIFRGSTQTEVSSLLKTVFSIVVYIIAFFLIFQTQYPGISLAGIFTGSTIVGIIVGLALQETLGNLFAGIALQADQPFQVGDVLTIPNRGIGVVETVSWRGVKMRTFQNKLLIISNAVLSKELIEVAPKNNLNARSVNFNTDYNLSPARTVHVVREALRGAENVSNKIRPNVRIRNFGEDGIDWEVKYWLDDYSKHNDTDALIRRNIWYAFNREKISFSSPSRRIHIQEAPEQATHEEKVNLNAERLNGVPIFTPLSDTETERLAAAAKSRIYAPGERIVRMGQEGHSMFVIVRGLVHIEILEGTKKKIVNTLGENEFFGEMSLLTGEQRTATVVADEETEVLAIDKKALKPILEKNPKLVEMISEIIDERKMGLEAASKDDDKSSVEKSGRMLRAIRTFFGLRQ
jgi:small-conductance mechanosensitive channel/CRP-like cAMP-binding protein